MQRFHKCIPRKALHVFKGLTSSFGLVLKRHLTVSETATALRPFYLAVHPDFFGQFPTERKVNEESLKKLHEYITDLQRTGRAKPAEIYFYIKDKQQEDFSYVKVELLSEDIRSTVSTVLKSVALSLDYLDTIPKDQSFSRPIKWDPTYYHFTGKQNPNDAYYQKTKQHTLTSWLQKNGGKARRKVESSCIIQEEIDKINKQLKECIGVKDIQWASDWSINHYMGCLRSFSRLCVHHLTQVRKFLQGRSLVFSNKTGVSLHGEVVLSSEDVTTDWMTLLSSVPAYDAVLDRLPYMEKRLSELLGNIKIERRKKRQIMMAEEYELVLNKILNTLRRCQDDVDRYLHGEDLSHLELIVEEDSAPLTLSATGKFLVPSSMPGVLLVKFISEHKEKAYMILQDMALQTQMEEMVRERCIDYFQLLSFKKEDNISPDKMTQCCERLLGDKIYLESGLHLSKLRIAHYYTVMQDGEMYIPWDWKSDIS